MISSSVHVNAADLHFCLLLSILQNSLMMSPKISDLECLPPDVSSEFYRERGLTSPGAKHLCG